MGYTVMGLADRLRSEADAYLFMEEALVLSGLGLVLVGAALVRLARHRVAAWADSTQMVDNQPGRDDSN